MSTFVKARLHNSQLLCGDFIKDSDLARLKEQDRWLFSSIDGNILIDGGDIRSIYLFCARQAGAKPT